MLAVSKKLIPSSMAFLMTGRLSSSLRTHLCVQRSASPNPMQPRQMRDTSMPVFPNFVYSIFFFSLSVHSIYQVAALAPLVRLKPGATLQSLMHSQTAATFQARRYREFDHEISDAFTRHRRSRVLKRLALLCRSVRNLIVIVEPGGSQNCVVEVRSLNHFGGVAIRVQDAAVAFAGNFIVNPHGADEYEAANACLVHGLYNAFGLRFQVASQVGINDILTRHCGFQCLPIQHIAFHNAHTVVITGNAETLCMAQIKCQPCIGLFQKEVGCYASDLTVRAENQNVGHEILLMLPTYSAAPHPTVRPGCGCLRVGCRSLADPLE